MLLNSEHYDLHGDKCTAVRKPEKCEGVGRKDGKKDLETSNELITRCVLEADLPAHNGVTITLAQRLSALDYKISFDFSRGATKKRIAKICKPLGVTADFPGDSIHLTYKGEVLFANENEDPFDVAALICLETLRFLFIEPNQPVPVEFEPVVALLARPHGTPNTIAACDV